MVERITEILAIYDPIELISIGCPRNEYEVEAEDIALFVSRNPKATTYQVADAIQIIFLRYFNQLLDMRECIEIAEEIR